MDNNYDEIGSSFIDENVNSFDLLIVTATKTEKDELHKHIKPLPGHGQIVKISKGKHTYYLGMFGLYPAIHVACNDMGATSRNGSITTTSQAISLWKPKAVLMIGIAFGINKSKQKIGDILISERVVPYESQRVGRKTISRAKDGPASSLLIDRFNSVTNWNYMIGKRKPQIIVGPVLSGEKLVDDLKFRNDLLKLHPSAIGGEMEGAGIYAACDDQVPHWIMVKAICDYGDGNKGTRKTHNQQVAISSAVSLCEHVFSSKHAFDDIPLNPQSYRCPSSSVTAEKKKSIKL